MKKIILFLTAVIGCAGFANAQYYSYGNDMRQIFTLNYQVNVPTGSTKDFISNTSFEGVNFNWAYFVTNNITVGVDLSYNNYHKNISKQIYRPNENMAINAAQHRYTQVIPIKAQVKYFFNPDSFVKGYAGLGLGALSAGQHIVVQDIDSWNNSWGFLVAPEVGVLIPFGVDAPFGANITAGYNFSTNKSTMGDIDMKNRGSFYINAGLYFAIF